jgi:hypothetical protein
MAYDRLLADVNYYQGEYVKVLKAREMAEIDTVIGIYNKKEKV